jgi:hypothetical protein
MQFLFVKRINIVIQSLLCIHNLLIKTNTYQDGKSNIWSIEPKMVVEEEDEEGEDGDGKGPNKNLVIGGAVIGAFLVALPIFTLFSKLVPNPDDF